VDRRGCLADGLGRGRVRGRMVSVGSMTSRRNYNPSACERSQIAKTRLSRDGEPGELAFSRGPS
jgi:hypothetical protein